MSKLVIVESPAKAKTIKKYLGPGFEVKASMGHIRDLHANKLSVDVNRDFEPDYTVIKGKEKLIENGFSSLTSDVTIIKILHKAGSLQELLALVESKGINIEYMYGLSIETEADDAYVVVKASDIAALDKLLTENNIPTISCEGLKEI